MRACLIAVATLLVGLSAAHAKTHARTSCGVLQKMAQEHSNSMAQRNMMDHAGFDERARHGAKAENVAYGTTSKAATMAMWWASPSHASNMQLPGCKAVASAVSHAGIRYWTMEIGR